MKNQDLEIKCFPTTLGLFLEWLLGWTYDRTSLEKEDVTAEMLDERLGNAVYECFEDGYEWDEFFGVRRGTFCDDATEVADFIRNHFNDRIYVKQYWIGPQGFAQFYCNDMDWNIECCDEFGTYAYEVNEGGINANL